MSINIKSGNCLHEVPNGCRVNVEVTYEKLYISANQTFDPSIRMTYKAIIKTYWSIEAEQDFMNYHGIMNSKP